MSQRRRLVAALGVVLFALATRTPGAGLFWMLCGGSLAFAAWRVPDSVLHRSRELRWQAAQERAAEGWPSAQDRLLILRDRIYRGTTATVGVFFVLYGLLSL